MGRPGWRPSAHGAAAIYGDNVRGDWKCDVPGRETDRGALAAIAEGGDALRATLASRQATAAVEAYWRDAEARGETGGLGATDDAAQREHDHKAALYRSSVTLGGGAYLNMTAEQSEARDRAAAAAALPVKCAKRSKQGTGSRAAAAALASARAWDLERVYGSALLAVDADTRRVYAVIGSTAGSGDDAATRRSVETSAAHLVLAGELDAGGESAPPRVSGGDPFTAVLEFAAETKRELATLALRCGATKAHEADAGTLRRMLLAAVPDADDSSQAYFIAMMLASETQDATSALARALGLSSLGTQVEACAAAHAAGAHAADGGRSHVRTLLLALRRLRHAAATNTDGAARAQKLLESAGGVDAAGLVRLVRLVSPDIPRSDLRVVVAALAGAAIRLCGGGGGLVTVSETAAAVGLRRPRIA